ncbi:MULTISPECIES: PadR family transcriptional regulator [unclassified Undibacterium]|uniref:PadR family transcriptional regulator n=1 Tax=unclassified Undibacterium TaxID=2630295 RepID=UPI002AC94560|nr:MULTISPECIES: PadR family transcriptional regulator [unclassified Undibacterium]MEB0140904.1 PadR family transcriptional regulator [Undibacterium sp. CCC2.1]MEB0173880.1 PadR family transcriptional regulator [Undibacterium sp. CCC1.1]MEB0176601.1 PadR family transcriptional regulator [Undibacterium sp. CCC3.4]MEB0217063.1 PadR family transcriptional regulator [Undibacterium sp. 5I2]WPX44579.1 PadR family transcriptional regulator [Undibacterium sp. CCC3.4]
MHNHSHSKHQGHGHGERNFLRHFSEHATLHAIGGRHGGGGSGHRQRGSFDGFGEGDGFPPGRKFTSQDLQLMILAMLAEKPAHGYELIKELGARSNGFYSPSPGMVYPALTYLDELGYITATLESNRKCYSIADEGLQYLAANQERVDMIFAKLSSIAHRMDSVRRAYAGEPDQELDGREEHALPELLEARHALKAALRQSAAASPDEQARIAKLLRETARAILTR